MKLVEISSLLFFLTLTACTTVYTKDPFDQQEFYRVSTRCQVMCRQAGAENSFLNHRFMDQCMAGYGWTKK